MNANVGWMQIAVNCLTPSLFHCSTSRVFYFFIVIGMCCTSGAGSAFFGMLTCKTPLSSLAEMFWASELSPMVNDRLNLPNVRS
eukprot:m.105645 g.105645  ORF g.105645 m.105645 type:complete len:84 (-) comp27665_c0_seq1:538-789(-)